MSILTPNRILQKGDEVWAGTGEWKPVPSDQFGLMVMFSKYGNMQIRRPSEPDVAPNDGQAGKEAADAPAGVPKVCSQPVPMSVDEITKKYFPAPHHRISPDSEKPETRPLDVGKVVDREGSSAEVTAKAEKETSTPAPTPSGAGGSPVERFPEVGIIKDGKLYPNWENTPEAKMASGLPTVVSKKAHKVDPFDSCNIRFDRSGNCIWTGRNGTFDTFGIELQRCVSPDGDRKVSISPIGKRGVGNCMIQFPASIIPKLVEWLEANKE